MNHGNKYNHENLSFLRNLFEGFEFYLFVVVKVVYIYTYQAQYVDNRWIIIKIYRRIDDFI